MPKFPDRWVIDKTMFEYVAGGSCACCGFAHFMPNGTAGFIEQISDLETDDARREVNALDNSPWPIDMRDQVWSDRLKLRMKLKKEMKQYSTFWNDHGTKFKFWCYTQSPMQLKKILQLPRTAVTEKFHSQQYNIHSAFGIVLCTVVEQVANFKKTGYPIDGRGESEINFEENLMFDRRGGFTMNIIQYEDDGSRVMNEEVLEILLNRFQTLGGPKLLDRNPKATVHKDLNDNDVDDDDDDDDDDVDNQQDEGLVTQPANIQEKPEPSFRLDRRVIRLVIARYWYDILIKRYLAETQPKEDDEPTN